MGYQGASGENHCQWTFQSEAAYGLTVGMMNVSWVHAWNSATLLWEKLGVAFLKACQRFELMDYIVAGSGVLSRMQSLQVQALHPLRLKASFSCSMAMKEGILVVCLAH
jgi:hypothetical protein